MNLRSLGKNTLIYSLGTIFMRAVSFIQIPIFTHYLTQSDYGFLSTLLVIIQVLITILDLGIRSGMMRFMPKYIKDGRLDELIGSAIFLNILGGTLFFLVIFILFNPVIINSFHLNKYFNYILLTAAVAISQTLCLNLMAFYRANNESIIFMVANIITAIALILGIVFFLIILKAGIRGILISQALIYGTIWVIITLKIYMNTGLMVTRRTNAVLLKFGIPLVFSMIGYTIITLSPIYFLARFAGFKQVAIYSLAIRITQITEMTVTLPFQMAYEPFVFQNLNNTEIQNIISKLATYYLITYAAVGFLVAFVFRDMIHLIAPVEYYPAYLLIFLFFPGSAMLGFQYIGQSLLHSVKKTHITASIVSSVSILCVLMNYLMIMKYGITGLIIAYNLTMIILAIMLVQAGKKIFPVSFEVRRLIIIGLVFIFLLLNIYIFRNLASFLYYSIVLFSLIIAFGMLYYGNFLGKNERLFLRELFKTLYPGSVKNNL